MPGGLKWIRKLETVGVVVPVNVQVKLTMSPSATSPISFMVTMNAAQTIL